MAETPTPRTEPSAAEKLCQWLRDNSSGDYRKCADAAWLIERQEMALQHLARVAGEAAQKLKAWTDAVSSSQPDDPPKVFTARALLFAEAKIANEAALSEITRIQNQTI